MLDRLRRRLAHLLHRDEFTADLQEEMRLHVDLRAQRLAERGIDDATHDAQRRFGNRTAVQDVSAEQWGFASVERLLQDLRHGVRALRKTPGFTALAILTLALGLGINNAVFSVVNAVILRSLPYPEPDTLISLWEDNSRPDQPFSSRGTPIASGPRRTTVSVANLIDYRKQTRAFVDLASYDTASMNLTGMGQPERLVGEGVEAAFFPILGITPVIGRNFLPEEDRHGGNPAVIITHAFWQRRLGGDPNVLSRSIILDGQPRPIVGVLPEHFQSPYQLTVPERVEFYVPAAHRPDLLSNRGDHEVNVVARLKPGVSIASAREELAALGNSLAQQFPDTNRHIRAAIAPLRDDLTRNVSDSMFALLGASALIVLITCVNVANLLLVRSLGRRHETSVRFALGASRFRIVRQFFTESALLAAGGLAAGILLGNVLMRAVLALAPPNIPRIGAVTTDWRVFGLAVAIATLTGIVFGIAPALQASQTAAAESLKAAARGTGALATARWRSVLTVVEVALSMVLLIGAGLLLKSFVTLMGVDLGFQPDRVIAMNINLPQTRYATADDRLRFFQQLEQRVRALPGVQSVTYANRLPLRGGWGSGIDVDTIPGRTFSPDFQAVSPGYFDTLGLTLMNGRLLTSQDYKGATAVAVVNQAFSRKILNGESPIGHRIRRGPSAPWLEIVGIVNDIRRGGKTADINPQVYLSAAQTDIYPVQLADFGVRAAQNPRQLVNAIQAEVWSIDKDQPITAVRTLMEIIDASVSQRRFQTLLLMIFAAVAVGLSVIGIYGVLAYSVSQRTSEIGIRIALGARPMSILGLVLKQAGALIGSGVVIGLAGAYALAVYVESLLFQVEKHDWRTYAGSVALLAAVAVVASLIPARRGSKVDPMVALRGE